MGTELLHAQLQQQPIGSWRSLSEEFIILRHICVQSRHVFSDRRRFGSSSSNTGAIPVESLGQDIEVQADFSCTPPDWVNLLDEFQWEMF